MRRGSPLRSLPVTFHVPVSLRVCHRGIFPLRFSLPSREHNGDGSEHQPEGSVQACGASLDYMLEVFPLTDVIRKVLTGSGECAKVSWTLLGLSMPGWVLIAALGLGAFGGWVNFPRRSRQQIAQQ